MVALTAVAGGLIKFTPTAWAQDPAAGIRCDFDYNPGLYECSHDCLGACVGVGESKCFYGPGAYDYAEIICASTCRRARVVVHCTGGGHGFFCGRFC